MIINPQDIKTSSLDRHFMRRALRNQMKADEKRLQTLKSSGKIEDAKTAIAYSEDLLERLSKFDLSTPSKRQVAA